MSPHLAAKLAPDLVSNYQSASLTSQPFPESNDELVHSISAYTRELVSSLNGIKGSLYVETAGGKSFITARLTFRRTLPRPPSTTHSIHLPTLTSPTSYTHRISTSRWYLNNDIIIRVPPPTRIFRLGRPMPSSAILPKPRVPY
jgi:hypothetical protein